MIEGNVKIEQEQSVHDLSPELQEGVTTNSFELKLHLKQDILIITLDDYLSWKSYQKTITRQIFTTEINPRLDLQDIFYALARKKNEPLHIRPKQVLKNDVSKTFNRYWYGDTIYNQFSEFQIQGNGVINVRSKIIHVRGDKSIEKLEKCSICLQEVGVIDQKDMHQVLYRLVTTEVHRQYQTQIQTLKAEIKHLKSQLSKKSKQFRPPRTGDNSSTTDNHLLLDKFPIFVNFSNGKTSQILVTSSTQIKHLKKTITRRTGMKWSIHFLQFDSKELKCSKTVYYYGIVPFSQIFVKKKVQPTLDKKD